MTTWCPDLDASADLLRELHGDPRFTEPDVAAPFYLARLRDTTESIYRNAAPDALAEGKS